MLSLSRKIASNPSKRMCPNALSFTMALLSFLLLCFVLKLNKWPVLNAFQVWSYVLLYILLLTVDQLPSLPEAD